jgi:hypothetical protein
MVMRRRIVIFSVPGAPVDVHAVKLQPLALGGCEQPLDQILHDTEA